MESNELLIKELGLKDKDAVKFTKRLSELFPKKNTLDGKELEKFLSIENENPALFISKDGFYGIRFNTIELNKWFINNYICTVHIKPTLTYDKINASSEFGMRFIKPIIELFDFFETVEFKVNEYYPLTLSNKYFEVMLAPRQRDD